MGIVVTRGKSLQNQLMNIVYTCARNNRVSNYATLGKFGVNPTIRQRQMVEANDENFAAVWAKNFVADKFGASTTHWEKLQSRIERGVGNPCPLLLLGIPSTAVIRHRIE